MFIKQGTILNYPPMPELKFDRYFWYGQLKQDYWIDCVTRVDLYNGKHSHDGSIILQVDPLKTPPSPEQIQAYEYFVGNPDAIYRNLMQAVFEIYPQERESFREGYGWSEDLDEDEKEEFEDDYGIFVPELELPDDLKKIICLRILHIGSEARDGYSYTGLEFDCNWEEEHGLGVLMHKDKVIKIGFAEVSFGSSGEQEAVNLNELYGNPEYEEVVPTGKVVYRDPDL